MKLAIQFIALLLIVNILRTSSGDCNQINDADQRHFCLALSKPDKGECEFIKNHDLRYECRARVSK